MPEERISNIAFTRGEGEAVRIGEHTRVTVVAVDGKRVRIAVSAPRSVPVDREEVFWDKRNNPR